MTKKLVNQEFQWVARIKKNIIYRILKKLSLENFLNKILPSPRDILLKRIPKNSTCVEIGVWTGEFTQRILNIANPRKLYLIGPWLAYDNYYEMNYKLTKYTQTSQDKRYKSVLKRFDNHGRKNNSLIKFPFELDLCKYCVGYKKNTYKYNLISVANHIGSLNSGHYFSYVKNTNDNWYKYDDTMVSQISKSDVVSESAYCLFYQIK